MIRLDAATVLLQWSVGGLVFLWVTTRHRLVGLGYGWLLRGVFGVLAAGAIVASRFTERVPVREVASAGVALATAVALGVSIVRRRSGVRGQRVEADRKRARVAAMSTSAAATSATSTAGGEPATASIEMRDQFGRASGAAAAPSGGEGPEFPPVLDLIAPLIGLVGLVAAGWVAGGNRWLAVARTLVGAVFLGAVSDAMLLGHWYLVQPGLPRKHLNDLVRALGWVWPVEIIALLLPIGMVSVWSGSVSDGWGGQLGWFWAACAITTLVLVVVTKAALRERYYSAVMAATGLLYLAILTAFGTDLVARAILAG